MRKLILLIGPTCTGKSTLEKALNAIGIPSIRSYTTRTPRTGEVHGVDYDFVSREYILAAEAKGEVIQKVDFNGNFYGSTQAGLDAAYATSDRAVIVVEPTGLTQFFEYARHVGNLELVSVYLDNSLKTLVTRLVQRFRNDQNADPAYYWRRLDAMTTEHQYWPDYNATRWSIHLPEHNDTTGPYTTKYAVQRILDYCAK